MRSLLDNYGSGLRPFLVHDAPLQRPPTPADRTRLVAPAEHHGEAGALDGSPL